MDLSVSRLGALGEPTKPESCYPTFAAPTPIHLNRGYTANTLTPGSLPSPLNFPSITPPSSPYSFYGLYSPAATPRVSPMYDPAYLKRLKSNPIFRDLQSVLLQDCLQMEVPANLITTSWNLMQLHKPSVPAGNHAAPSACQDTPSTNTTSENITESCHKVYTRHMQLQDKLLKVRIDASISADGLAVENVYSKEVGQIEMNRYRALHSCPNHTVKTTINSYYDRERMNLANNTEKKLDSLIDKAETMRQAAYKANTDKGHTTSQIATTQGRSSEESTQGVSLLHHPEQRRLPSQEESAQGASLLLHPVDDSDSKLTAVRKLKFNLSDDHMEEEDEENDYLNGSVNSEDFEIDEIDVETIDKDDSEEHVSTQIPNNIGSTMEQRQTDAVCYQTSDVVNSPVCSNSDNESSSSDILQQCIAESGLEMLHHDELVSSTTASVYPISSNNHNTDSISHINSVVSSNRNISPQILQKTVPERTSAFKEMPPKSLSFSQDMFGTPNNLGGKFAQPDQINMALSEIGKLCGGPSVTFTPELRREITMTSFTPETTGFSPFANVNNSIGYPASTSQHSWNSSPIDMAFKSESSTGSGQKRKRSEEDEAEQCHHHVSHMTAVKSEDRSSAQNEVSSATGPSDDGSNNGNSNPMFRTHRMLTAEATTILNHWYSNHVQYPYPNDEEVKQLSQLTNITGRQVKKWMANKRVRCFNTLSITGNQHPIKFKYNGRGRKKKAAVEKENCDSTTQDKRMNNYSLLSEEAKLTLNSWYEQHQDNPYPSEEEKQHLATACNISVSQVKSWFANKRNRTNNTRRQVPNYFISKFPEYSNMVQFVGQKREEARMIKRRKLNQLNMYIQPNFYF